MKNLRSFFLAFAALFMATAAHAQQQYVKANVPFDFVVGNRAYPAGEYYVKAIGEGSAVLLIDNRQEAKTGMVLSITCAQLSPSDNTKLVFHRVGNSYFLSQMWTAGNTQGWEFPMSRTEIQISQNREKPEMVIVAANISR
jgi:hypothetical protein